MRNYNFLKNQYSRHAMHFTNDLIDPERVKISKSWFDNSTADFWRHDRAYECASLLRADASSSWLTIGDGRWGLDSIRIRQKGFNSVMPSDISETLLKEANLQGLIKDYSVENAEKLSFKDQSFDYVFCKEALHHFPRPYLALYEMLRVARKGVFIIEPNDTWSVGASSSRELKGKLLFRLYDYAIKILNIVRSKLPIIEYNQPSWEDSGNYVFPFSQRELKKIALGLNLPQIVTKGLNDHYIKGCEFEPADIEKSPIFSEIFHSIRNRDILCNLGFAEHSLIMAGLLLRPLEEKTRQDFVASGWSVEDLPDNPYVPRCY